MLWHKLFSLKIEKDLFFMALSIVTHLLTKQGISVNVFLVIQILSKKQRLMSSVLRIFETQANILYSKNHSKSNESCYGVRDIRILNTLRHPFVTSSKYA